MTAEWHYGEEEPSNGPVSLEELKQLVASGQVQPTYMVWKAGMPEWRAAGEVEELFPKQATVSEAAPVEQPPLTDQPVRVALASHGRLCHGGSDGGRRDGSCRGRVADAEPQFAKEGT